jgi:hypothetical protein
MVNAVKAMSSLKERALTPSKYIAKISVIEILFQLTNKSKVTEIISKITTTVNRIVFLTAKSN